jgi:hypothetical protein
MTKTRVGSNGSLSLSDFAKIIQENEQILGPLTELSHQGSDNVATFDADGPTLPADRVVEILPCVGDVAPARQGYDVVCKGDCLVLSQPMNLAAYRRI